MKRSRVGYDNSIGYLDGGFDAWKADGREVDQIKSVHAKEFAEIYTGNDSIKVLDVRKPTEWEGEHLENSDNFPLDFISSNMHTIDKGEEYYLHCRTGYRSTVAASILKSRGFDKVIDIIDTLEDMTEAGIPTTDYVCPSKKVKA
ncbi:MAG: rhodanese-like domain-containing protein [Saprospiraceae bacterium]